MTYVEARKEVFGERTITAPIKTRENFPKLRETRKNNLLKKFNQVVKESNKENRINDINSLHHQQQQSAGAIKNQQYNVTMQKNGSNSRESTEKQLKNPRSMVKSNESETKFEENFKEGSSYKDQLDINAKRMFFNRIMPNSNRLNLSTGNNYNKNTWSNQNIVDQSSIASNCK